MMTSLGEEKIQLTYNKFEIRGCEMEEFNNSVESH